jgi:hypothetical protein
VLDFDHEIKLLGNKNRKENRKLGGASYVLLNKEYVRIHEGGKSESYCWGEFEATVRWTFAISACLMGPWNPVL